MTFNNRNIPSSETALITGATSGIGYELAKIFAKQKYNLVIVARHEDTLEDVANYFRHLGAPRVLTVARDLSRPGAASEVYEYTVSHGIHVDILVNDAGAGEYGFFSDTDIDRELEIIQLNVISLVHLTKLYLRDMLSAGRGKILQLASVSSYQPTPLLSVYAATKAFVLSFTDSLINELEGTGVTITALIPGATATDFFRKAHAEHTKAAKNDPAPASEVARIGYEGLMKGKHHAVAGAGTQANVLLSNVLPNESVASIARRQMEFEQ
jgi:uncharacterized protein